ncbi:diol dehydratase small subunit [Marinisporobacter balticus]|uniref:Propanediol dehydratase small subunit n=1 Tax=Marinisporobacter balticus TaxID=2018667 RepID=A0A4R2KVK1_9FIRM|nr:diol dehydratase small subunit [Marinisporobacter balticus]TCO77964.1 propanediol dehydratase small subunit [Marinisporobacter balticus]
MMENKLIEQIVREVMASMGETQKQIKSNNNILKVCKEDYPLGTKRPELVKSPTGKSLDDITIEKVMNEQISSDDLRISAEVLEYQAQVAESVGRDPFARNLRRAAELTKIPDDRILEIYNALRPYRSTKADLMDIADELENKYGAKINADFVREATDVYQERKRLKGNM